MHAVVQREAGYWPMGKGGVAQMAQHLMCRITPKRIWRFRGSSRDQGLRQRGYRCKVSPFCWKSFVVSCFLSAF